ncbi:MAG: KH domain-containing protein [Solirubrobacteraceae bacterium]
MSAPRGQEERVRELVERVVAALGVGGEVRVEVDEDRIRAVVAGDDLGLLIGHHGQTIDAIQHLAYRAAFRPGEARRRVEVDASGYRERRAATLRHDADRAAYDALRLERPVTLEPMSAVERRLVHEHLRERGDVETYSEGEEPERRLVIAPPEG